MYVCMYVSSHLCCSAADRTILAAVSMTSEYPQDGGSVCCCYDQGLWKRRTCLLRDFLQNGALSPFQSPSALHAQNQRDERKRRSKFAQRWLANGHFCQWTLPAPCTQSTRSVRATVPKDYERYYELLRIHAFTPTYRHFAPLLFSLAMITALTRDYRIAWCVACVVRNRVRNVSDACHAEQEYPRDGGRGKTGWRPLFEYRFWFSEKEEDSKGQR